MNKAVILLASLFLPLALFSQSRDFSWEATPSQISRWASPDHRELPPGGPEFSFKVALPEASTLPAITILQEQWQPICWRGGTLEGSGPLAFGRRGERRGVSYAELLLRPIQPDESGKGARVLVSLKARLDGAWKARGEGTAHLIRPTARTMGFLNPQDVPEATGPVREAASFPPRSSWPGTSGSSGVVYRLSLARDGLYRLTQPYLASQGVDFSQVDPRDLHLLCRGVELPILVLGEGDGRFDPTDSIVFYGQALSIKNRDVWNGGDFTDTNVYWLYADSTPGLRMTQVDAAPSHGYPVTTQFTCTLHFEQNTNFDQGDHFRPNGDLWFWDPPLNYFSAGYAVSNTYSLSFPNPVPGSRAQVSALMAGYNAVTHQLQARVNGAAPSAGPDPATFQGHGLAALGWIFSGALSPSGSNVLTLTIPGAQTPPDNQILDYLDVTYSRGCTAENGALLLTDGADPRSYEVGGFTDQPYLLDISSRDPSTGLALPDQLVNASFSGGLARFDLAQGSSTSRSVLLSSAPLLPTSIQASTSRDLSDPSLGADLLIITHPDLHPSGQDQAWQAYLARRRSQMSVQVVDIQEVYDNFSYGIFDPTALRTFLSSAAALWRPAPKYVLLMGAATYDYKNYSGQADFHDWVPTLMIEDPTDSVYMGVYASDSWFADVDGDGFPDMAVGRLPARSNAELEGMLTKLLAYETQALQGDWFKSALYVADTYREDWEQEFEAFSSFLQATFTVPPWSNQHIYFHDPPYNGTDDDACAADIRSAWPTAGLIHYDGHSGIRFWSYVDGIFSTDPLRSGRSDVDLLPSIDLAQPSAPLPFVVNSSCYNSAVHWPLVSVMQDAVVRPDRGAIGAFGYTGLAYTDEEEAFAKAFYGLAFGPPKVRTVGDLVEAGRFALPSTNTRAVFSGVLLGDPSMDLPLPAPPPPASLYAMPADGTVVLSWNAPPEPASRFGLYRYTGANPSPTLVASPAGGDRRYEDAGLANGTTYTYYLASFDGDGFEGPPGPAAEATPDTGLCSVTCQAGGPTLAAVDTPVQFQSSAAAQSCLGDLSYDWDFGDGSPHASEASPSHGYTAPGTYEWTFKATADTSTCAQTGTLSVVVPPAVTGVKKKRDPLRISVTGSGIRADVSVFVGGTTWPTTRVSPEHEVILKGPGLKKAFPAGTYVPIRLVNGDGGETTISFNRSTNQWRPGG